MEERHPRWNEVNRFRVTWTCNNEYQKKKKKSNFLIEQRYSITFLDEKKEKEKKTATAFENWEILSGQIFGTEHLRRDEENIRFLFSFF